MKKKLSLQDFAEILAQREDIDRKAADAFARSFFDIIDGYGRGERIYPLLHGFGRATILRGKGVDKVFVVHAFLLTG